MIGRLTRALDTPLSGRRALEERVRQLREQAKALEFKAELLEALLAVLPELGSEADAALALLVTERN